MKLHTLARPGAPRRTGTVIVVVAVCLIGILAFVALALDGGMLLDKRRQAQCASDAAALAAANDMYANWWANKGSDPNGTARAAALAAAAANGYADGANGCTVRPRCWNCPPTARDRPSSASAGRTSSRASIPHSPRS